MSESASTVSRSISALKKSRRCGTNSVDQEQALEARGKLWARNVLKPREEYVARRRNDDRFSGFSQTAAEGVLVGILLTHLSPWLNVILESHSEAKILFQSYKSYYLLFLSDFRIKIKLLHMAYKPQADPCSFIFLCHPLQFKPLWTS